MAIAVWVEEDEYSSLVKLRDNHGIGLHVIKSHKRPGMVAVVIDDDIFDRLEDYRKELGLYSVEPVYADRRYDPADRGLHIWDIGAISSNSGVPSWKLIVAAVGAVLVAAMICISIINAL